MAITNHSIDQFDLYEAISLARSLENHECLEFRRISSYIYRKQQRWNDAINLSKKDKLYGDCIETASQSRNPEVVEPLLRFFCDEKLFECFAASTYVCYDLVQPDVILELAWRNQAIDFAMPYLIQNMREQNQTIAKIHEHLHEMGGKVEETKEIAQTATAIAVTASQQGTGYAASPFPDAGFPADPNAAGFGSVPPPAMPAASANPFMAPQTQPMGGNAFPPQAGSANAFGNFPPPQFPPF